MNFFRKLLMEYDIFVWKHPNLSLAINIALLAALIITVGEYE